MKEEFRSDMLHEIMNISRRMIHSQQVEETRVKSKSRDSRGKGLSMVVLQRVDLTFKKILGLIRGLLIKFLSNSQAS